MSIEPTIRFKGQMRPLPIGTVFHSAEYVVTCNYGGFHQAFLFSQPVMFTGPDPEGQALAAAEDKAYQIMQRYGFPPRAFMRTVQEYDAEFTPHREKPMVKHVTHALVVMPANRALQPGTTPVPVVGLVVEIRHVVSTQPLQEERRIWALQTVAHKLAFMAMDRINGIMTDEKLWAQVVDEEERQFIAAMHVVPPPESLEGYAEKHNLSEYVMAALNESWGLSVEKGKKGKKNEEIVAEV